LRWKNSSNITNHFSHKNREKLSEFDPYKNLMATLSVEMDKMDPLAKAQYIEMVVFLSGYLLSSQGDRMGMANSVEGRYPFLDHRIIEFCASLPPDYKLKVLNEKVLLKKMMKGKLPEEILNRPKQAYRAPILSSFLGADSPEFVMDVLSEDFIIEAGIFNPVSVSKLLAKMNSGKAYSEIDNMAITAIISTQLLYKQFIKEFNYLDNKTLTKYTLQAEENYN
jgi:asparagine synthase (glutamine-hydrolysing)